MHNDLYPDMVIGCLKARTVPVNVNYNYTPREVAELLDYVEPRAVIYHRVSGREIRRCTRRPTAPTCCSPSTTAATARTARCGHAWTTHWHKGDTDQDVTASPDDLLMICTGGTTGRPKGVLWRQADIYVSSMMRRRPRVRRGDPRQACAQLPGRRGSRCHR